MIKGIWKILATVVLGWFCVAEHSAMQSGFDTAPFGQADVVGVYPSMSIGAKASGSQGAGVFSLSGEQGVAKSSTSLFNLSRKERISAGAGAVVSQSGSLFTGAGAGKLYSGFDAEVPVANTMAVIGGPAKLPPDGPTPAFPPVGDGLVALLLMALGYAVVRRRRSPLAP